MDGILNDRINNWIKDFSNNSLDWDSYHIDELQKDNIPKSKWINNAFKIYSLCVVSISRNNTNITAALCFELNITTSHRPVPISLSRQCFNKTDTPPEIFLFKNEKERSISLSEAVYLRNNSILNNMQVYLLEKKNDVYWRWLFFMDKET